MNYFLSNKQLADILQKNSYVLLRRFNGDVDGVNCKVINLKHVKEAAKNKGKTNYISFRSCTFMEYLNHKIPFK